MTGDIKFSVSLVDGISPSAKASAGELKKLAEKLGEAKTALSTYQQQLTRANVMGDVEGHKKYAAAVAHARAEVYQLTDALGPLKRESRETSSILTQIAEGVGLERLGEIALETGKKIVEGVIDVFKETISTAIEVADENARLSASFEALGGAGAGTKTLAFVDDLARKLPQSSKELAGWVSEFQAMGMTDLGQIKEQVLATASAQAITFAQGGQGAAVYTKLAEKIHLAVEEHKGLKLGDKQLKLLYESGLNVTEIAVKMGLSVEQLGARLKAGTVDAQKFGNALSTTLIEKGKGPLEAMGDSLGVLYTKAKETWRHFFDDIDASPITDAIKSVISLGDQGEPSGKALKKGIGGAVQEVIKWVGVGITEAEILFLELELWAIQSGISMKDVKGAIKEIAVDVGVLATMFMQAASAAMWLGKAINAVNDKILEGPDLGGPAAMAYREEHKAQQKASGNADGGIVTRPAAGEYMASVEPGEMIVPRRITRQIQNDAQTSGGGGGGEKHYHFDGLQLTIHADKGVTDATAISATGLSVALERLQLGSGR